jgi:transcriptional regulator with XRE-family HTH domain
MNGIEMRQTRKSRGMTIGELATQANVATSVISRYERGLADMHSKSLKAIEAVLGDVHTSESPVISELREIQARIAAIIESGE